MASLVQSFIECLHELERGGDSAPLLELFEPDGCEVSNVAIAPLRGRAGAQRFWMDYRSLFKEVRTEFTRITETDSCAFLEWVSHGVLNTGKPIVYGGVTILDLEGDRIARLRAYHDSAAFMRAAARHLEAAGPAPERQAA